MSRRVEESSNSLRAHASYRSNESSNINSMRVTRECKRLRRQERTVLTFIHSIILLLKIGADSNSLGQTRATV